MGRGVPVMRPTMEEFESFSDYVLKISPIGFASGLVKVFCFLFFVFCFLFFVFCFLFFVLFPKNSFLSFFSLVNLFHFYFRSFLPPNGMDLQSNFSFEERSFFSFFFYFSFSFLFDFLIFFSSLFLRQKHTRLILKESKISTKRRLK